MSLLLWLLAAAGAFVFDRLMLKAEERGRRHGGKTSHEPLLQP
jgi:hypothetical protein